MMVALPYIAVKRENWQPSLTARMNTGNLDVIRSRIRPNTGRTLRKRRSDGHPTIADVATRAGVGAITVSRALRNPRLVSKPLRHSIEKAVRELNYVPNLNARALASARSETIGVLVPALTQNVFADVLRGIYDGIEGSGLRLEIANTRYDAALEERQIAEALRHSPSGMIVSGIHQTPAGRAMLQDADCPVIQIMDIVADPVHRIIGFSHREGGRRMTRHLVDAGYRRIAFLGTWMGERSMDRIHGYQDALEEAGLFDPALVRPLYLEPPLADPASPPESYTMTTPALGRKLLADALDAGIEIDAVFCNSDVLALGALFECVARGIRVPQDMGIAGFNDLELIDAAEPSLSTVRTPRWEVGYQAARAIDDELNGVEFAERVVDLGVEVKARASSAGPAPRPSRKRAAKRIAR